MTEIYPDEVSIMTIEKSPITGYLAWYKFKSYPHWTFLNNSPNNCDATICPYPLFKNIDAIKKQLLDHKINIDVTEIIVLKVTL